MIVISQNQIFARRVKKFPVSRECSSETSICTINKEAPYLTRLLYQKVTFAHLLKIEPSYQNSSPVPDLIRITPVHFSRFIIFKVHYDIVFPATISSSTWIFFLP
jgi:hypothetical protein